MSHDRDVVIVGAGRVGLFLARVLSSAGRPVTGVVVRSDVSADRVRAAGFAPLALDQPAVGRAGTLLLSVADDDLPSLVAALPATPAGLVAHTSGRYGLSVLAAAAAPTAAIHPAMTFTGTLLDVERADQIVYGVTAEGDGLLAARGLVHDLGGRAELVPEQARPLYHAAMSHAANHLVTLIADAADLLRRAGVTDTSAMLAPITAAALANVLTPDERTGLPAADAALTGPIVRGDVGTVAAHLVALAEDPAEAAYRAMARRTVQRAVTAGRLGAVQARQLLDLLDAG